MQCVVHSFRSLLSFGFVLGFVCVFAGAHAHGSTSDPAIVAQRPDALVRDVVHNEIEAQLQDNSLWCHIEQAQEDAKPSRTLEVCQTRDGDLERLVAVNGRELSLAQSEAEDQRIQEAISHPDQLKSKLKK